MTAVKPEKKPMSPAEKEVMDAIRALIAESPEVAPNQRQIAGRAGKHETAVSRAIASLIEKGWLKKGPGHYSIRAVS